MELNSILYAAITKEVCDRACEVNSYETITKRVFNIACVVSAQVCTSLTMQLKEYEKDPYFLPLSQNSFLI